MNKKKKKNLEIFDYYFFKTRRIVLDFILAIYWKTKRYFYNGNFSKKHLTFGVVDGKIQITSTSHNDYIAAAQKRINKLSKLKKRKKFIGASLKKLEKENKIDFMEMEFLDSEGIEILDIFDFLKKFGIIYT